MSDEPELYIRAKAEYEDNGAEDPVLLGVHLEGGPRIEFQNEEDLFVFFYWLSETFERPVGVSLTKETTEYTAVMFG